MGFWNTPDRISSEVSGFSLVELLVVLVILAIATPMVFRIAVVPSLTSARAKNFQLAERTAEIYALRSESDKMLLADVPNDCAVEVINEEFDAHAITCTHGSHEQVKSTATANIFLQDRNPYSGEFVDVDRDGYEDNTGLPTHYDECYSGWKGTSGANFKDSVCELGGKYVIPLYAKLYN